MKKTCGPDSTKSTMESAHDSTAAMETDSTVSESSAAIVSLYNSWSTTSESISFYDNDDSLLLGSDHFDSLRETEPVDTAELLKQLKERCRHEDIPHAPILRRRRRPVCQFRNFIGSRQYDKLNDVPTPILINPPLMVFELPFGSHDLDFGLDERDALFPLVSSFKEESSLDGGPALKRSKTIHGSEGSTSIARSSTSDASDAKSMEVKVEGQVFFALGSA
jgi:hypothetical protein